MATLACACLNVRIHVKDTNLNLANSIDGADGSCSFFKQPFAEAKLHLEGIEQVHSCLVSSRTFGSWTVFRCHNCQMSTHALHCSQPTRLLVNLCLHKGAEALHNLERSSDFSPLFKIVIRDQNANRLGTVDVDSGKYEALQQEIGSIQQKLNRFLQEQEQEMEARIKKFEEQQRASFAELERKARQDKNSMIHLILSAEQPEVEVAEVATIAEEPETNLGESPDIERMTEEIQVLMAKPAEAAAPVNLQSSAAKTTVGFNANIVSSSAKPTEMPAFRRAERQPASTSVSALSQKLAPASRAAAPRSQRTQRAPLSGPPEAALFVDDPFFGLELGAVAQPFYQDSEDDDDHPDTDDSEDLPGGAASGGSGVISPHQLQMLSTSVPISIPAFTQHKRKITFADEATSAMPIASPDEYPEDIAASIKALARSVHGDGKDIFGELPRRPRPRVHPEPISPKSRSHAQPVV